MNRPQSVLPLVVVLAASAVLAHSTPVRAAASVAGRVTDVILYRGQAQVTRTVAIPDQVGNLEVVVSGLPAEVMPASLFAEGDAGVEIRAVRFRARAVGEEPREEVRKLDRQIVEVQQQLDLTGKRQALLTQRTAYLGKLEGFIAPTAHADLARGVLDAEALQQISLFVFQQRDNIATDEVKLAQQARDLHEQLHLLQRKRAEITGRASRTVREAVLFLEKQVAGPANVRLNYLASGCGWSPSYTMRAGGERAQVRVQYNALIHQRTGENWNDVELTLSTASPALSAAGPGLAPFHVALASASPRNRPAEMPQQQQAASGGVFLGLGLSKGQVLQQVDSLNSRRSEFAAQAGNAVAFDERNRFSWNLNDVAGAFQQLEINGDTVALGVLQNEAPADAQGPSLSYRLPGGVSLASRSDQQMVRIMQTDMPSQFYHVAVPVLTSYVYREAELTNSSSDDLLAGPMSVYLDGRFVGRGEIPTVARGQTFIVGFGADPQLRVQRELVDKQDSIQGGNREVRMSYRIAVENFADSAIALRVIDRLPHADNGDDIRITLAETKDPISEDRLYQRQERPMGFLRWDVEVPAGAAGEDARLIEYQYTMEYDRKFVVSLPSSGQTLQEEFNRLQRERQKR